jgi:transposase InsO family protein
LTGTNRMVGRCTASQIAQALGMARSTVGVVLRRLGLGRLANLDPNPPVVRYERSAPGEMIHLDNKKLGKIKASATASRPAGRACRPTRATAGTSCTSAAMTPRAWPTPRSSQRAQGGHYRLLAVGAGLAPPPWRQRPAGDDRQRLGLPLKAVRQGPADRRSPSPPNPAYTPRTNGKAERFIQTSLREWAYAKPYGSSAERTSAIGPWTDSYNLHRPHSESKASHPGSA